MAAQAPPERQAGRGAREAMAAAPAAPSLVLWLVASSPARYLAEIRGWCCGQVEGSVGGAFEDGCLLFVAILTTQEFPIPCGWWASGAALKGAFPT